MSILPGPTPASVPKRPFFPWSTPHLTQLCALQGYQVGGFTGNHAIPFAPVPKKKALLISINYEPPVGVSYEELHGPQKDVQEMHDLLTCTFGYKQEDVVVLSDREGMADNLVPTHANIMRELLAFLDDQSPGDQYVFLFAGRASQIKSEDRGERDGYDEQIITSDGRTILDDDLNKLLVRPLKENSRLTAIFDSCHSGTLLDLPHDKCNRAYSFASSKRRYVRRGLEPVLKKVPLNISNGNNGPVLYGIHAFMIDHFFPEGCCSGYCPRRNIPCSSPTVVCISACKDNQSVYQTKHSITRIIVESLRENPHPTIKGLMNTIIVGLRASNDRITQDRSRHHRKIKYGKSRIFIDFLDWPKHKPDPQLSSLWPLRTEQRLEL